MVIWLIGLSDSGKTTVGKALTQQIRDLGKPCVFLDGDINRAIFGNELSHTLEDRRRNADRVCRLCAHLGTQEVNVVCGVLSIFHESQDWNRENTKNYFEVYLKTDIELLKQRDTKGIYGKAARGEIQNVVGVDMEFPEPKSPNMELQNDFSVTPQNLALQILKGIREGLV